jgi:hypothetical protein
VAGLALSPSLVACVRLRRRRRLRVVLLLLLLLLVSTAAADRCSTATIALPARVWSHVSMMAMMDMATNTSRAASHSLGALDRDRDLDLNPRCARTCTRRFGPRRHNLWLVPPVLSSTV